MCSSSIKLPKDAIKQVSPTGAVHTCCNKRLTVVEIEFDPDKTIPINEFVRQLLAKLVQSDNHHMGGTQQPAGHLQETDRLCVCWPARSFVPSEELV